MSWGKVGFETIFYGPLVHGKVWWSHDRGVRCLANRKVHNSIE